MDISRKRTFRSFGQFFQELFFLLKNNKQIKSAFRNTDISPTFQERLMLAVTSVNDCRYCSYHHTQMALQEGISAEEAGKLLEGSVDNCPPEEATALLYAQHWAENDGNPDAEVVQRIIDNYSKQTLHDIDMILHMIRMGNYSGNAVDMIRAKFSFRNK
ncbi:MAG: carboxymuconolactone decarboxylase family protein [Bacillota bacterium]|nr:carboxymuconolactone decarboxylase family protein [Bacillota bacterium]